MTTIDYKPLDDGESVIDPQDNEELLFRQMPHYIWDSESRKPVSHAFGPKDVDKGAPSFSRSTVVSAQESRDWHNTNATAESHAVFACSVNEVAAANTRTIDDSAAPLPEGKIRAPGHAYVDYRHLDKRLERYVRQQLLQAALKRGERHTAP